MRTGGLFVWMVGLALGQDASFDVRTVHESAAELATRDRLLDVARRYDLRKWTFTRRIEIDERAIPHSHPVLTLSTAGRNDDAVLIAQFIHEQTHWFESAHVDRVRAAVKDLEAMYPDLPEKPPDGARDRFSSYMHLLICTWELEGVTAVLGEETARKTLERSAARFYRGIYRRVLDDTARIRSVIGKHGLRIPEPR